MTLAQRAAQFGARPRLRYASGVWRSCIHHNGGHLLPGLIVHRLGAYHGGRW